MTVEISEGTWYIDPCLATKRQLSQQNSDFDILCNITTNCLSN